MFLFVVVFFMSVLFMIWLSVLVELIVVDLFIKNIIWGFIFEIYLKFIILLCVLSVCKFGLFGINLNLLYIILYFELVLNIDIWFLFICKNNVFCLLILDCRVFNLVLIKFCLFVSFLLIFGKISLSVFIILFSFLKLNVELDILMIFVLGYFCLSDV